MPIYVAWIVVLKRRCNPGGESYLQSPQINPGKTIERDQGYARYTSIGYYSRWHRRQTARLIGGQGGRMGTVAGIAI